MPQRQRHRGRHPEDGRLFNDETLPRLVRAVADLSWLFSRGYAERSAHKIVGDRYELNVRQRRAISGAACSDCARERRAAARVAAERIAGAPLAIDGYNLLITVEGMLSGGLLFRGRDGCLRDLAGIHGSYHKVEETPAALEMIGRRLSALAPAAIDWLFDAPVSNSGKLRRELLELAAACGWNWRVTLDNLPDRLLAQSPAIVISSDSWVLDRCGRWHNFAQALAKEIDPPPEIIKLAGEGGEGDI